MVIDTWSRRHCIDPAQAKSNAKKLKKAKKKAEKKRLKELTKNISLLNPVKKDVASSFLTSSNQNKGKAAELPLVRIRMNPGDLQQQLTQQ